MTNQTPMTLTADDCRAMRAATSVVVHIADGRTRLTLNKDTRRPKARRDGFTEPQQTLERELFGTAPPETIADFVLMYANHHGNWRALCQLVRPGDVLTWYADDTGHENQYLRAAVIPAGALSDTYHPAGYDRIYIDVLGVNIERKGRQILQGFDLLFTVCPNNTARAIRTPRREAYSLTE